MKITKISIANQRQLHHTVNGIPASEYPRVELIAELSEPDDDPEACAAELRVMVEAELAKHTQMILDVAAVNKKIAEEEQKARAASLEAAMEEKLGQLQMKPGQAILLANNSIQNTQSWVPPSAPPRDTIQDIRGKIIKAMALPDWLLGKK